MHLNIGSVVSGIGNVIDFGNGWFRCSATYTASPAQTQFYIVESLMQDSNTSSYQGDGSSGLHLWGFQAEAASYNTSYIKSNSGSATTRSAETANNSGDASTFNDSEGVLMAEISALADDGTSREITLSDGSTSNRIIIEYSSISNRLSSYFVLGGSNQVSFQYNMSDTTINSKILFKYKLNDFSLWVDGFEVLTDPSGNIFTQGTLNKLNFDRGTGGNPFYGSTKQIQYFDSALNDSDLETLTSWVSFSDMAEGQLYSVE